MLHNHTIFCRVALLGPKKALNNVQWGVNNVLWSPLKIILFLWWVSYRPTFPYFKIMGLNWRCSSFVVFIMVIGTNVGVVLPWPWVGHLGWNIGLFAIEQFIYANENRVLILQNNLLSNRKKNMYHSTQMDLATNCWIIN